MFRNKTEVGVFQNKTEIWGNIFPLTPAAEEGPIILESSILTWCIMHWVCISSFSFFFFVSFFIMFLFVCLCFYFIFIVHWCFALCFSFSFFMYIQSATKKGMHSRQTKGTICFEVSVSGCCYSCSDDSLYTQWHIFVQLRDKTTPHILQCFVHSFYEFSLVGKCLVFQLCRHLSPH